MRSALPRSGLGSPAGCTACSSMALTSAMARVVSAAQPSRRKIRTSLATLVTATPTLPGPEPKFYFAPVQIRKRNADWGHAEVNRRFNEAQLAFIRRVRDGVQPWLALREHRGLAAAQALIAELHAGRIDPQAGHVVVLD